MKLRDLQREEKSRINPVCIRNANFRGENASPLKKQKNQL